MKTQPFPIPKKVKKKEEKEEEEIFDLDDESRFEGESLSDAILADELRGHEKEKTEPAKKEKPGKVEAEQILQHEEDEIEEIGKEYEIAPEKERAVNVPNIPINIKIPEDKDEIKINLNLQIVIKKK